MTTHRTHDDDQRDALAPSQGTSASRGLFDELPWSADPVMAFDHWLARHKMRAGSATVYGAMWGRYLHWLAVKRIGLLDVDVATVGLFLGELGSAVKRPQRERYRLLLERVYDELAEPEHNPARLAMVPRHSGWRQARGNAPTTFLDAAARAALVEHLEQLSPRLLGQGRGGGLTAAGWRALRGRALYAVFLGGGLKLREALALRVQDVAERAAGEYWLTLPATGSSLPHESVLRDWAARWFGEWLEVRAAGVPRSRLSPTIFTKAPGGGGLTPSSVNRALTAVLDARHWFGRFGAVPAHVRRLPAEAVDPDRIDPQALRNSFAGTLFEAGEPLELVAERLGYADLLSAQRLHLAWQAGQDEPQGEAPRDWA